MSLPTRDSVPDDEKWDPSLAFESADDWDAAADEYEDRLDELREYEGRATEDGETLRELLDLVEELKVRRLGSLWLYAQLTSYVDTGDEAARERMSRYRDLRAETNAVLGFLEPELRQAGRERVAAMVESTPGLESHEGHLDRLLAGADHALSPATESALAELEPVFEAGSDVGRSVAEGDFDPPTVETPGGETRRVTPQARSQLLQSDDREFRREVHERYREALREHRHGMAAAYVARIRADCRRAAVRGYDSALERRLGGRFPVEAYETVIDGIAGRLDPHHRLLSARASVVDGDELREWDRQAPIADGEPPTVPYDEAVDLIVDALEPLGEAYVDRAAEILAERRVDVRQTANKRRGPKAILVASAEDGPFLGLNYDGGLRGFYLFVHELGHAMHRTLAGETRRAVDEGVPDHVGEVPSFVHEALLVDHLADAWDDDAALHARATFLDKLPTYRAARGARFVHGLHRDVADGADPGPDALDDRHRELVSTFDEPIAFGDDAGAGWQEIDLSRDPYHAYLYAVGSVGALSVVRALREGDLSAEEYREMLRRGRSRPPNEAFAPALDFTDDATIRRGIAEYADRVDAVLSLSGTES